MIIAKSVETACLYEARTRGELYTMRTLCLYWWELTACQAQGPKAAKDHMKIFWWLRIEYQDIHSHSKKRRRVQRSKCDMHERTETTLRSKQTAKVSSCSGCTWCVATHSVPTANVGQTFLYNEKRALKASTKHTGKNATYSDKGPRTETTLDQN